VAVTVSFAETTLNPVQEPLCEQDAAEVERRAKRRRLHEGSLASRQHSELRRRLVDAVCELEISGNEVSGITVEVPISLVTYESNCDSFSPGLGIICLYRKSARSDIELGSAISR